jgi:hypothetical protein
MTLVTAQAPHITAHFVTSHNIQKTKAIRCGAFNYSIVVNMHHFTSMANTDIDAVRKQKKAEYTKKYRFKRKLLLQQQASKDIYLIGLLSSLKMEGIRLLFFFSLSLSFSPVGQLFRCRIFLHVRGPTERQLSCPVC